MDSINHALPNGYKFSFKSQQLEGCETPKFVSIQIPSGSLVNFNNHTPKKQPKSLSKKRIISEKKINFSKEKSDAQKPIHFSGRRVEEQQVNTTSKKKRKIIHTTQVRLGQRLFKNEDKRNFSLRKLNADKREIRLENSSQNLRRSRSERSSRSEQDDSESQSYLQLYRNKKNKFNLTKQKFNKTKITFKNEISVLNFLDFLPEQSPKSVSSFKSRAHLKNYSNLFSPKNQNTTHYDIINTNLLPQTTKSNQFMQTKNQKKIFSNSELREVNEAEEAIKNEKFYKQQRSMFKAKPKKHGNNDKIADLASKIQRLKLQLLNDE